MELSRSIINCSSCARAAAFSTFLAHKPTVYTPCIPLCLRARDPGQSGRCAPPAPIRTPERSSRLGGQKRILFTRPRVKDVLYQIHFLSSLSVFGQCASLPLGAKASWVILESCYSLVSCVIFQSYKTFEPVKRNARW